MGLDQIVNLLSAANGQIEFTTADASSRGGKTKQR
jgi:hypothetical protein